LARSRQQRFDLPKMIRGVELLLEGMGVDHTKDPNFKRTPLRVARMFKEMLRPRRTRLAIFPAEEADLILLRGHPIIAICPHHLQPVEIRCHIGYIPNRKVVGLSKLARIAEAQLTVPILQEDLARRVAETLDKKLSPKGVGVVLAGVHGCMKFRGVETDGDVVVSVMKGALMKDPTARQEFLKLIGRP
jgi:GTP cyclohydrolase I